jgi:hypothetical protein
MNRILTLFPITKLWERYGIIINLKAILHGGKGKQKNKSNVS